MSICSKIPSLFDSSCTCFQSYLTVSWDNLLNLRFAAEKMGPGEVGSLSSRKGVCAFVNLNRASGTI